MRIAVITGGNSSEREVSLGSAKAVKEGLIQAGYTDLTRIDTRDDIGLLNSMLEKGEIDFAFIMIHGMGGEDGQLNGLFDAYNIPYQCASQDVLALTMNKYRTKCVWRSFGLPVADDFLFQVGEYSVNELDHEIQQRFGYPCVLKELDQGSSKGVYILQSVDDVQKVRSSYDSMKTILMLEEYLVGQELTTAILDIKDGTSKILPTILIEVEGGGDLNFENKYNGKMNKICPAPLDDDVLHLVEEVALKAYKAVGCTKQGRVDMILTKNGPVLLEINTIPGFTSTSLFPKAAKVAGYSFPELLDHLIHN